MKYYYQEWSPAFKNALKGFTESEAKQQHQARELYYVISGSADNPDFFITINNTYIGVGFNDLKKRNTLVYTFVEMAPGKLFLDKAQSWEYEGDSDTKVSTIVARFSPEGKRWATFTRLKDRLKKSVASEEIFDNSSNWVPYPEFGQYEELGIRDRVQFPDL